MIGDVREAVEQPEQSHCRLVMLGTQKCAAGANMPNSELLIPWNKVKPINICLQAGLHIS